jgi:hypothetical protein
MLALNGCKRAYGRSETINQRLLGEAGSGGARHELAPIDARGAQAAFPADRRRN